MQKNKMQSITAYNLRKLCHYVHHSWSIILVALILYLSSSKDFPTFVSKGFAAIRFLMNYARKDVVLNLNGEAGFAIFSVS